MDFTQDSIEMFKGATLHVDHQPAAAECLKCGDEFSADAPQPMCPQCGSRVVRFDPDAPMVQLTDGGTDDSEE